MPGTSVCSIQLNEQRLVWWLLQSLPSGDKIAANEALSASNYLARTKPFFRSFKKKIMNSFFNVLRKELQSFERKKGKRIHPGTTFKYSNLWRENKSDKSKNCIHINIFITLVRHQCTLDWPILGQDLQPNLEIQESRCHFLQSLSMLAKRHWDGWMQSSACPYWIHLVFVLAYHALKI